MTLPLSLQVPIFSGFKERGRGCGLNMSGVWSEYVVEILCIIKFLTPPPSPLGRR